MPSAPYNLDTRVVMTLDAGGTNFRFSAMRGAQKVTRTIVMPSEGKNLDRCLARIIEGFAKVKSLCPAQPAAISFAFPGPADYPNGIIGDLGNLPCFRGGVALGPMLKRRFGIPVFINNDGDLFAYGESIAGFLPWVNGLLEKAGSQKRYKNLLGVTLGTGLGGGIVHDGTLFLGDNSVAGEMWLLRHKLSPRMNAEEGASLRAIQRVYAEDAGISLKNPPPPKKIASIARGKNPGCQEAAVEAFRRLGEVLGDALANALTLTDSLAVIGGGISKADQLFLPAVVEELNASFTAPSGRQFRRLSTFAFNLEEAEQRKKFLAGDVREITIPGTTQKIKYDSLRRVGVGLSRLGTSEAVAIGAHVFALRKLDAKPA